MLLMVKKGIRGRVCHAIFRYAEANNKYMKNYDKNKESSSLKDCDIDGLYGWTMSQKLPLGGFKWVEETCQFNEAFIKSYKKDSDIEYFIEADVQYLEKLHELYNDLSFLPGRINIEDVEKLVANLKMNVLFT